MLTKYLPIFALTLLFSAPAFTQPPEEGADGVPQAPQAPQAPPEGAAPVAPPGQPPEQPDTPPAVATVEEQPITVTVELAGHLESAEQTEIILRPEVWQVLEVEEAVALGKRVKAGDVLVRLKTEDIDKRIKEVEADHRLSELALAGAEQEYQTLQKTVPMDLEANERTYKQFKEDYKQYREVDLPYSIESAKWDLESAEFALEYEAEELKQLQQMYEADEITEDTEEIILTRQKRSVENAERRLKRTQDQTSVALEVNIPRETKQWEDRAIRAEINYKNTKETLPRALEQKRIAYEKAVRAHEQKTEELENLRKKDREMMVVKSPTDGIVYYGALMKGQPNGAAMQKKLEPRGKLAAGEIIMTIVQPGDLIVRTTIPEDKVRYFTNGAQNGKASLAAFPDADLKAKVKNVSPVPVAAGQFDATVEISGGGDATSGGIVPGLAAKLSFTPYENDKARVLPEKSVFTDDAGKRYVHLVTGEGKHERRDVETGEIASGKVEITKGLDLGAKVLLEKPEDE